MTTTRAKPVFGLVGGVGSGKSTIARYLKEQGAAIIDGDVAGHEVLRRPDVRHAVVARWGTELLETDGEIDRPALGRIVFSDAEELRQLEALVHPLIKDVLRAEIERVRANPRVPFVVVDAALLFEARWQDICDAVIFVDAPDDVRQRRVQDSRGWGKETWQARENLQLPLKEKKTRADYVVDNSGTPDETFRQVQRILPSLVAPLPC